MVQIWPPELILKGVESFDKEENWGINYRKLEDLGILQSYITFVLKTDDLSLWAKILKVVKGVYQKQSLIKYSSTQQKTGKSFPYSKNMK